MAEGDTFGTDIDEDINFVNAGGSISERKFDETIGYIEDIIMGEDFQKLQKDFLEKYWQEFEDTEENKFVYTDIHQEYSELIEKILTDQLQSRIQDFDMNQFQQELLARKSELDSEIFDILLSFTDFIIFKEMMIDYRLHKEGKSIDLSGCITTYRDLSSSPPQNLFPISNGNHFSLDLSDSGVTELEPNLDLLVIGTSITPRS